MTDTLVASFKHEPLDDQEPAIRLCPQNGIAYQVNPTPIHYGEKYFSRYVSYKGGEISTAVHASRVALCRKYECTALQDWGIGSGEFIEAWQAAGGQATGYDVNPCGVRWLVDRDLFSIDLGKAGGVCFWDSLEHVPHPSSLLKRVRGYAFVTMPIIKDLKGVRSWRHYRPHEHLHYFTACGLVAFAALCGLEFIEANDMEHQAGRTEDIRTFVFRRRDARAT